MSEFTHTHKSGGGEKNSTTRTSTKTNSSNQASNNIPHQRPYSNPREYIMYLQRTIGNQAVGRLWRSGVLQRKLNIGPANDKYEQEADHIADQVVSMNEPTSGVQQSDATTNPLPNAISRKPLVNEITPLQRKPLQRQTEKIEEDENVQGKQLQRQTTENKGQETCSTCQNEYSNAKFQRRAALGSTLCPNCRSSWMQKMMTKPNTATGHGSVRIPLNSSVQRKELSTPAPYGIESAINSTRNGGKSLSQNERSYFEPRFGTSFANVRLHTDSNASQLSRSVNARAFTTRNNIYFGAGEYSPNSIQGKRLMAHELTHTVQQRGHQGSMNEVKGVLLRKPSPLLNYDTLAQKIYDAISGFGTDEEQVYRALGRLNRDPGKIAKLKKIYKNKYSESLISAIQGDFSGTELEYALQLLNKGKSATPQAIKAAPGNKDEYTLAANRIRKAVEGVGTDEEAIFAVLISLTRLNKPLTKLSYRYYDLYHENMRERIGSELSGSEKAYAFYLLNESDLAKQGTLAILQYIKSEAEKQAKNSPLTIDPSSKFYKELKNVYLKDYLANPSQATGKKGVKNIGRQLEGRFNPKNSNQVDVRPENGKWRPAENKWEKGGFLYWNKQKVPEIPSALRDLPIFKNIITLPPELAAGTDVLIKEKSTRVPFIDVPFLLGVGNANTTTLVADVVGGGTNISQLMHWATGVKYSDNSPEAMRELFLAYEIWHLEAWDVFGQDPLNDMIAEEQGRLLGTELRKGKKGSIKKEADLLPFLDRSFREARAWVGSLLKLRKNELDNWITAIDQKRAVIHWNENVKYEIWPETSYQKLAKGTTLDDVKKSSLVESQIEIYRLIFEAQNWEKANGKINITPLQKALVEGKLNSIFIAMANNKPLTTMEKLIIYNDL
ncbi:MAG: DUF4157 domain-containing protein [Leptospirales bacterium]